MNLGCLTLWVHGRRGGGEKMCGGDLTFEQLFFLF